MVSSLRHRHHVSVLWFYSQDLLTVKIETRYDNDTEEYVLIVHRPSEDRQEERFVTLRMFRERILELQKQIRAEGWTQDGPPMIVPDGWPDKPPVR
jgi:hypothetical protein